MSEKWSWKNRSIRPKILSKIRSMTYLGSIARHSHKDGLLSSRRDNVKSLVIFRVIQSGKHLKISVTYKKLVQLKKTKVPGTKAKFWGLILTIYWSVKQLRVSMPKSLKYKSSKWSWNTLQKLMEVALYLMFLKRCRVIHFNEIYLEIYSWMKTYSDRNHCRCQMLKKWTVSCKALSAINQARHLYQSKGHPRRCSHIRIHTVASHKTWAWITRTTMRCSSPTIFKSVMHRTTIHWAISSSFRLRKTYHSEKMMTLRY